MPVYVKAEPLQQTGSFKIRGATNAIFSLSDEDAARGVRVAARCGVRGNWLRPHCGPLPLAVRLFSPLGGFGLLL